MEGSALQAILNVVLAVISWFVDAFEAIVPIFWATGSGLTFMGVLAVASLSISIGFLLIGVVQRFLKFRG